MPLPIDKFKFHEDWREGCPQLADYMEKRVNLDWSIGDGPARLTWSSLYSDTLFLARVFPA